jgi:hypothetical protein
MDTPFTTRFLQEEVGWLGIGPSLCMMLDGTYDPPNELDEYDQAVQKKNQGYRT